MTERVEIELCAGGLLVTGSKEATDRFNELRLGQVSSFERAELEWLRGLRKQTARILRAAEEFGLETEPDLVVSRITIKQEFFKLYDWLKSNPKPVKP